MNEQELMERLAEPFPVTVVSWKPQTLTKDKTRALAGAYIDARDVAQRLDEVVGSLNWAVDHKMVGEQQMTGLAIRNAETGEWITKWDAGFVGGSDSDKEDDQMKAIKGTASDGLKRAAVLWGIGRYLYSLPKQWVDWDDQKRQFKQQPTLPEWALPTPAPLRLRAANGEQEQVREKKVNGRNHATAPAMTVGQAEAVVMHLAVNNKALHNKTLAELKQSEEGRKVIQHIAETWQPNGGGGGDTTRDQRLKQAAKILSASFQA
jgi:hypothetical protein